MASPLERALMKFKAPVGVPRRRQELRSQRNFHPVSYKKFYTEKKKVEIEDVGVICVYTIIPKEINPTPEYDLPVFVLLHGGGYSSLTWSHFAVQLSEYIHCIILAIDLRGHGETQVVDEMDLSNAKMINDILMTLRKLKSEIPFGPLVIVGHSMGGALAVHLVSEIESTDEFQVGGLVVIDVVEGSALDSLRSMQSVLRSRPQSFDSFERAIEWSAKTGQSRDLSSIKVSVPGQLKLTYNGEPATCVLDRIEQNGLDFEKDSFDAIYRPHTIVGHEKTDDDQEFPKPYIRSFSWRIDLSKTEPYWQDWFKGLSAKFLTVKTPKFLILAGVDRLDKNLTVGQMQGKFQMQVFHNVGHAVQEDNPMGVAAVVSSFVLRHKLTSSKREIPRIFPGC